MSLALTGIGGIFLLLATLFLLGMPVGFAMGIVGFLGFCHVISFSAGLNMVGSVVWDTFSKYGLTVIPLFIFMGQIAFYSGVNRKPPTNGSGTSGGASPCPPSWPAPHFRPSAAPTWPPPPP